MNSSHKLFIFKTKNSLNYAGFQNSTNNENPRFGSTEHLTYKMH